MKRIFALLLALTMIFALCACGGGKTEQASTPEAKPTPEAKEAKLAVEDFEITKVEREKGKFLFRVKIRNISDADLDLVEFDYQILDANGDILQDMPCGASNVEAGQAIWAGAYSVKFEGSHFDEAVAIRFVPAFGVVNELPLKEKVTFQLEDYMK